MILVNISDLPNGSRNKTCQQSSNRTAKMSSISWGDTTRASMGGLRNGMMNDDKIEVHTSSTAIHIKLR